MLIPDYDFELFEIPYFSALEANEYGAATRFQSSDPTAWVDYSLNQLYGLVNPQSVRPYPQRQFPTTFEDIPFVDLFQSPRSQTRAEIEAEVERNRIAVEKARDAAEAPVQCPEGYSPVSVFGLFSYCGKDMVSDGKNAPLGDDPTHSGKKAGSIVDEARKALASLPSGSGVFLIAIVAIIFLVLFVRR